LKVRDFGPGLPVTVKGNDLFEKFTRGESESNKRGVGLGLAICKAIVEAHRGQISAAQAVGGGAEFTVTLPRTPPPDMPILEPD
jgi:two-component system sensor histidine kinase KdpD